MLYRHDSLFSILIKIILLKTTALGKVESISSLNSSRKNLKFFNLFLLCNFFLHHFLIPWEWV